MTSPAPAGSPAPGPRRYSLTPQVDLAVFYVAEMARYVASGNRQLLAVVTPQAFADLYKNSPSLGFACNGQAVGGVIFDGEQAHIAVLPEHHGHWGLLLKPACRWLFAIRPEILVAIEKDNATCLAFMDRNRWQRIGADGDCVTFRMTDQRGSRKSAHPFARRRPHEQAS